MSEFAIKKVSKPWSRQDVLDLLSCLNLNIGEIREGVEEDQKKGVGFACELLSNSLGAGCTPTRVSRKISHLWKTYGEGGSETVLDIYRGGAWHRTVPDLNQLYPCLLEDIALQVKHVQNQDEPHVDIFRDESINWLGLRRTERRNPAQAQRDPIDCRCGFTHDASSTLYCDRCHTWQHVFCYFGTDSTDGLKNYGHLCDKCLASSTNKEEEKLDTHGTLVHGVDSSESVEETLLSEKLASLSTDDGGQKIRLAEPKGKASHLAGGEPVLSVVHEEDVAADLRVMAFKIRTIAKSLSPPHWPLGTSSGDLAIENKELKKLFEVSFGPGLNGILDNIQDIRSAKSIDPVDITKALIAAANYDWIFQGALAVPSAHESLLEAYQSALFVIGGLPTLQRVHRAAWTLRLDKFENRPELVWKTEAELLRRRFISVLEPYRPVEDNVKSEGVPQNFQTPNKNQQKIFEYLEKVFTISMQFKAQLPLTEDYYEVFLPVSGSVFEAHLMETEGNYSTCEEAPKGSTVLFSIAPAIIQYASGDIVRVKKGIREVTGLRDFVNVTKEQRAEGKVLGRAIVRLRS